MRPTNVYDIQAHYLRLKSMYIARRVFAEGIDGDSSLEQVVEILKNNLDDPIIKPDSVHITADERIWPPNESGIYRQSLLVEFQPRGTFEVYVFMFHLSDPIDHAGINLGSFTRYDPRIFPGEL